MIRCAYCDSVTLALDLNGVDAHVCPLCGAVFARRYGNTYSFIADLKGAQGVKELLHSVRPHDPLYRSIITAYAPEHCCKLCGQIHFGCNQPRHYSSLCRR
mgnify:CR=1 FL=1